MWGEEEGGEMSEWEIGMRRRDIEEEVCKEVHGRSGGSEGGRRGGESRRRKVCK